MSSTASNRRYGAALLGAVLSLPLAVAHATDTGGHTMYRWRDAQGRLQTGDSVPPEYSAQDVEVLNSRGVVIEAELSAEFQVELMVETVHPFKNRGCLFLKVFLIVKEG